MGFGGILKMWGERKTKDPYQPYKPFIREYEADVHRDIASLYSPRAYNDVGIGFTPAEMEGKFGEGRDLSAGAATASRQLLSDFYRAPGGLGRQSAAYGRAIQRENLAEVSRANELRRRMVVENARQSRADKLARLSAVGAAYGQGVGVYNQFTQGRNQRIRNIYGGAAETLDAAASAYGNYLGA